MRITKQHFKSILLDLIDENPIASRGIMRVCEVEFTTIVPTLGITLSGQPRMCVNLDFVRKHCRTEDHVKAVIVHEFLHVLLNHTERFKQMTPALNVALDGVINAIIHRSLGPAYSGMMSLYYGRSRGHLRFLRPMTERESKLRYDRDHETTAFYNIWWSLYEGYLVVDDLIEIAEKVAGPISDPRLGEGLFIGNHSGEATNAEELSPKVEAILRDTLSSMTGGGIWRNPRDRGVGLEYAGLEVTAEAKAMKLWETEAVKVLTECVTPDKNSAFKHEPQPMSLPVLNESDKRGFLRSLWSPFLPDIVWNTQKKVRKGTTQIYLDVSGSMNHEMDALVSLIWRLRRHIRLPFWAFSDSVQPAEIREGRLITSTTGGTSMDSVLRHVAETQPGKAVVITDGFIEQCDPLLLRAISGQDVRAIVSRDGSPAELARAGIPYLQLGRFA